MSADDERGPTARRADVSFRAGVPDDAPAILGLIDENLELGHLLPRTIEDVTAHASRFTVITDEGRVVGCAELAPLSRAVAEVRSLVVDAAYRGMGLGTSLIAQLCQRARVGGFATLCAFTHEPSHFVRLGFTIVPHVWFPEKIALDCVSCRKFRVCGQAAVSLQLDGRVLERPRESHSRLPVPPGTKLDAAPLAAGPRLRTLPAGSR
jgi:N-acetylglutamate synthase-like GNAT family acetyltransferase